MEGHKDGWTNKQTERQTDMDRKTNGQKDKTNGQKDGQMEGHQDGWTNKQTYKQTQRQTGEQIG
jgi:hypothetical protein